LFVFLVNLVFLFGLGDRITDFEPD
jgi:hypothetical protein